MASKKIGAESQDVAQNREGLEVQDPRKKKKHAEARPHKRLLEPLLFKRFITASAVGLPVTTVCNFEASCGLLVQPEYLF